jgi:hypothetical protein
MFLGDGGVMEDLRVTRTHRLSKDGVGITWHVKNENIVDITHENRR